MCSSCPCWKGQGYGGAELSSLKYEKQNTSRKPLREFLFRGCEKWNYWHQYFVLSWKKGNKTDWVLDCPTTLRSNYHKKMKQTPISAKQLDRDTSCKFNTYHILLLLSLAFPYIQNLPIFLLLTKSFLKKPSVH